MMDRKAQLSIFLVIALVIVAAVILVGFLFSQGKVLPLSQEQSTTILGSQVSPVKDLISSCVEDATTSGLQFVGARGGYASYTEQGLNSIDFAGAKVVVLARTEKGFVNRLPSKEEFERQISAYLNDEEQNIISNFYIEYYRFIAAYNKEENVSLSTQARLANLAKRPTKKLPEYLKMFSNFAQSYIDLNSNPKES